MLIMSIHSGIINLSLAVVVPFIYSALHGTTLQSCLLIIDVHVAAWPLYPGSAVLCCKCHSVTGECKEVTAIQSIQATGLLHTDVHSLKLSCPFFFPPISAEPDNVSAVWMPILLCVSLLIGSDLVCLKTALQRMFPPHLPRAASVMNHANTGSLLCFFTGFAVGVQAGWSPAAAVQWSRELSAVLNSSANTNPHCTLMCLGRSW